MNFYKYLTDAGVPTYLHEEAVNYLENSAHKYANARISWYKLTAWAVVGWLLVTGKVKFEDETLPGRWWKYDNEVSMNGDRGNWTMTPDGYAQILPCPMDDSALQWSYFPPHHPRSKWHRWQWLGFRNMASKLAESVGPEIYPEDKNLLERWGNPLTDRATPGVVVHRLRGHWSLYVVEKAPFGLIVRRNVGVKLAMAVANFRRRAPIVNIKWSLVRAKKV